MQMDRLDRIKLIASLSSLYIYSVSYELPAYKQFLQIIC